MKNRVASFSGVLLLAMAVAFAASSPAQNRSSSVNSNPSGAAATAKNAERPNNSSTKPSSGAKPTNSSVNRTAALSSSASASSGVSAQDSAQDKDARTQSTGETSGENVDPTPVSQAAPVSALAGWTTNPLVIVPIGLVILISLGLHFVRGSAESKLKRDLAAIRDQIRRRSETPFPKPAAVTIPPVSKNPQHQSVEALESKVHELQNRAASIDSTLRELVDATLLIAEWTVAMRIEALSSDADAEQDENKRLRAIEVIARHQKVFADNARRVRPLADAVSHFAAGLKTRPGSNAEFIERVGNLSEAIHKFDHCNQETEARLKIVDRTALEDSHSTLSSEQRRLTALVVSGAISIAAYVDQLRRMVDERVSAEAVRTFDLNPSEYEAFVREELAGVPDFLMDWFDTLCQLRSQLKAGAYSIADSESRRELDRIQSLAEETLAKFDIQPEEIDVGLTSFDRRLHDTALVQRSHLPANTIVAVQRYGFKRLSSGDVLRRPSVVVSGAGAF